MQKFFAHQGDAFLDFAGNDLSVIRIIAFDQLGDDQNGKAFFIFQRERRLIVGVTNFHLALVLQAGGSIH